MTGNLSFQIEHHLFPDLPSNRYAEIAPRVRAVCERYGLPYSSGRLGRQYLSVARKVLRLSFPGGKPKVGSAPVERAQPRALEPAAAQRRHRPSTAEEGFRSIVAFAPH
jgi:linoleoyl-CoA desaturase